MSRPKRQGPKAQTWLNFFGLDVSANSENTVSIKGSIDGKIILLRYSAFDDMEKETVSYYLINAKSGKVKKLTDVIDTDDMYDVNVVAL